MIKVIEKHKERKTKDTNDYDVKNELYHVLSIGYYASSCRWSLPRIQ